MASVKLERGEDLEITRLRDLLAKKTAEHDIAEGKLACNVRHIKQLDAFIAKLEEQQLQHFKERQAWTRERVSMESQLAALQEQLDLTALLKRMQQDTQSSSSSEDRASSKRARTML